MIITEIRADNVLKYSALELADLPIQGVVAVEGQNESGKSSIGEIICFTLFGRTFSFGKDELNKIICWGQTRCAASLSFRLNDGQSYQVSRYLDTDGNQGAKLVRLGETEADLAHGVEAVDEAVEKLLGYDFEEFIESFYLAQREISTTHRHSEAVKAMAGLAAFEDAGDDFKQEIREAELALAEVDPKIEEIDSELAELNIQEGQLAELESQQQTLAAELEVGQDQIKEMKQAADNYQEYLPMLAKARRGSTSNGVISGILFLATLASAAIAWMPQAQHLQGEFPWGLGAGIFGIMFVLSLARLAILKGRIEGLQKFAQDLAQRLKDLPEVAAQDKAELSSSDLASAIIRIQGFVAEPDEVRKVAEQGRARLEARQAEREAELEEIGQSIFLEKERVETAEKLRVAREAAEANRVEQQHRIDVRDMALDLLAGAGSHLSQRFNRDLRDLVGRTLPLFTEGRYAHLKIDDELNVQVFSNEKRDFMQLEEVSSGTQRQIMLAIRLALSQQLLDNTTGGSQFLFLDEPFAFFDQERTRSTLAALPKLSDELSQIWIVAQEFPQDAQFDYFVECARERSIIRSDDQAEEESESVEATEVAAAAETSTEVPPSNTVQ